MVIVGEKRGNQVVSLSDAQAKRSALSILRTRFSKYFLPINSFLNEPNPFDLQSDRKKWLAHERFITSKFAGKLMDMFPALKSGDFDQIFEVGISPRILQKDPSPESVRSALMGYFGYQNSPRWGLLGMLILLEQIENAAHTPDEFHQAVKGFFEYMSQRFSSYTRAYEIILNAREPDNCGVSMSDFIDSRTGVPLSHLVVMNDLILLNIAYHPGFSPEVYAEMAREWVKVPNSYGESISSKLFDSEGRVIGGSAIEAIRSINHEEQFESNSKSFLEGGRKIGCVLSLDTEEKMPKSS